MLHCGRSRWHVCICSHSITVGCMQQRGRCMCGPGAICYLTPDAHSGVAVQEQDESRIFQHVHSMTYKYQLCGAGGSRRARSSRTWPPCTTNHHQPMPCAAAIQPHQTLTYSCQGRLSGLQAAAGCPCDTTGSLLAVRTPGTGRNDTWAYTATQSMHAHMSQCGVHPPPPPPQAPVLCICAQQVQQSAPTCPSPTLPMQTRLPALPPPLLRNAAPPLSFPLLPHTHRETRTPC